MLELASIDRLHRASERCRIDALEVDDLALHRPPERRRERVECRHRLLTVDGQVW
jgi:hypothetical protein